MATLRTEEEKSAIVAHCMELEKAGGDILGYLRSENYVTPRATWFNFQRGWLGRKPYQYTDGKPKKKGEKKMSKPVNTSEDRQRRLNELIERIKRGMGIRAALADMGYTGKSAGQQYRQIRNYAEANDPNAFRLLPEKISDSDAPVVKLSGPIVIETPEASKVQVVETPEKTLADAMTGMKDAANEFFGKCEDMGLKMEKPAEVKPLTLDEFEIAGIRHQDLGEWYYDKKFNSIDWRTPEGDEVSLPPVWWKQIVKDLPKILRLLGVDA